MRTLPLNGTAIAGVAASVALAPNGALAADPIKLTVGGFFREAYMVVIDDDDEFDFGNERNSDGFFNDAEIHFTGSTVLDNGLEVGARVELEGETEDDQIDEAWVWFAGGFGEFRIGSEDEALENACIAPPGGTTNFSAFSPNQWGSNATGFLGTASVIAGFSSNSICAGVDEAGDAQKIVYISPNFSGFQLTASYTPNGPDETHDDGVGPHIGMPAHGTGAILSSRHNASVYLTYSYDGENWGLTAGLGGSWEGHVEESGSGTDITIGEQDFYQAGINLTFGNFAIGVAGEYYNHVFSVDAGDDGNLSYDIWVAGIGAAYTMDAWTFGVQYSHRDDDFDLNASGSLFSSIGVQQDRAVVTAKYALGPGIVVDGEIGYTWFDSDPEFENFDSGAPDGIDDYDALEFGIGTAITF